MNAPVTIRFFDQLGAGLGWRPNTVLAMVWIYFDESGEHAPNGMLRRLTLGCGIAPFESWQSLSSEWTAALLDAGLPPSDGGMPVFHMVDFEARVKPFNWDNEKRKKVLNDLLGIAGRHISYFWGFNDNARDISTVNGFRDAYESNLAKALKELVKRIDEFGPEPITMVFARHKNISAKLIGEYFDVFKYWAGDRIEFGGFGDPARLPALQCADLVAYEFSRTAREKRPVNERYPLLNLAGRANAFTLFHASQLGRDRSVWGRPLGGNGRLTS